MQKKVLLPLAVVIILGIGAVGYVLIQKEKAPVPQESSPTVTTSENTANPSETITSKDGWKNYSSSKLGISFQYPEKVSNQVSGLDGADEFVPVKVVEDAERESIYLTYGPYSDTLESLRSQTENATTEYGTPNPSTKPFYGWKMITKKVQNDDELNAFVKDRYGKGCYVGEREEQPQKGVYKLTIKGEDWGKEGIDLGNTTCPWGAVQELLQATNSKVIVSINRGQEASFDNEEEILASIKFN